MNYIRNAFGAKNSSKLGNSKEEKLEQTLKLYNANYLNNFNSKNQKSSKSLKETDQFNIFESKEINNLLSVKLKPSFYKFIQISCEAFAKSSIYAYNDNFYKEMNVANFKKNYKFTTSHLTKKTSKTNFFAYGEKFLNQMQNLFISKEILESANQKNLTSNIFLIINCILMSYDENGENVEIHNILLMLRSYLKFLLKFESSTANLIKTNIISDIPTELKAAKYDVKTEIYYEVILDIFESFNSHQTDYCYLSNEFYYKMVLFLKNYKNVNIFSLNTFSKIILTIELNKNSNIVVFSDSNFKIYDCLEGIMRYLKDIEEKRHSENDILISEISNYISKYKFLPHKINVLVNSFVNILFELVNAFLYENYADYNVRKDSYNFKIYGILSAIKKIYEDEKFKKKRPIIIQQFYILTTNNSSCYHKISGVFSISSIFKQFPSLEKDFYPFLFKTFENILLVNECENINEIVGLFDVYYELVNVDEIKFNHTYFIKWCLNLLLENAEIHAKIKMHEWFKKVFNLFIHVLENRKNKFGLEYIKSLIRLVNYILKNDEKSSQYFSKNKGHLKIKKMHMDLNFKKDIFSIYMNIFPKRKPAQYLIKAMNKSNINDKIFKLFQCLATMLNPSVVMSEEEKNQSINMLIIMLEYQKDFFAKNCDLKAKLDFNTNYLKLLKGEEYKTWEFVELVFDNLTTILNSKMKISSKKFIYSKILQTLLDNKINESPFFKNIAKLLINVSIGKIQLIDEKRNYIPIIKSPEIFGILLPLLAKININDTYKEQSICSILIKINELITMENELMETLYTNLDIAFNYSLLKKILKNLKPMFKNKYCKNTLFKIVETFLSFRISKKELILLKNIFNDNLLFCKFLKKNDTIKTNSFFEFIRSENSHIEIYPSLNLYWPESFSISIWLYFESTLSELTQKYVLLNFSSKNDNKTLFEISIDKKSIVIKENLRSFYPGFYVPHKQWINLIVTMEGGKNFVETKIFINSSKRHLENWPFSRNRFINGPIRFKGTIGSKLNKSNELSWRFENFILFDSVISETIITHLYNSGMSYVYNSNLFNQPQNKNLITIMSSNFKKYKGKYKLSEVQNNISMTINGQITSVKIINIVDSAISIGGVYLYLSFLNTSSTKDELHTYLNLLCDNIYKNYKNLKTMEIINGYSLLSDILYRKRHLYDYKINKILLALFLGKSLDEKTKLNNNILFYPKFNDGADNPIYLILMHPEQYYIPSISFTTYNSKMVMVSKNSERRHTCPEKEITCTEKGVFSYNGKKDERFERKRISSKYIEPLDFENLIIANLPAIKNFLFQIKFWQYVEKNVIYEILSWLCEIFRYSPSTKYIQNLRNLVNLNTTTLDYHKGVPGIANDVFETTFNGELINHNANFFLENQIIQIFLELCIKKIFSAKAMTHLGKIFRILIHNNFSNLYSEPITLFLGKILGKKFREKEILQYSMPIIEAYISIFYKYAKQFFYNEPPNKNPLNITEQIHIKNWTFLLYEERLSRDYKLKHLLSLQYLIWGKYEEYNNIFNVICNEIEKGEFLKNEILFVLSFVFNKQLKLKTIKSTEFNAQELGVLFNKSEISKIDIPMHLRFAELYLNSVINKNLIEFETVNSYMYFIDFIEKRAKKHYSEEEYFYILNLSLITGTNLFKKLIDNSEPKKNQTKNELLSILLSILLKAFYSDSFRHNFELIVHKNDFSFEFRMSFKLKLIQEMVKMISKSLLHLKKRQVKITINNLIFIMKQVIITKFPKNKELDFEMHLINQNSSYSELILEIFNYLKDILCMILTKKVDDKIFNKFIRYIIHYMTFMFDFIREKKLFKNILTFLVNASQIFSKIDTIPNNNVIFFFYLLNLDQFIGVHFSKENEITIFMEFLRILFKVNQKQIIKKNFFINSKEKSYFVNIFTSAPQPEFYNFIKSYKSNPNFRDFHLKALCSVQDIKSAKSNKLKNLREKNSKSVDMITTTYKIRRTNLETKTINEAKFYKIEKICKSWKFIKIFSKDQVKYSDIQCVRLLKKLNFKAEHEFQIIKPKLFEYSKVDFTEGPSRIRKRLKLNYDLKQNYMIEETTKVEKKQKKLKQFPGFDKADLIRISSKVNLNSRSFSITESSKNSEKSTTSNLNKTAEENNDLNGSQKLKSSFRKFRVLLEKNDTENPIILFNVRIINGLYTIRGIMILCEDNIYIFEHCYTENQEIKISENKDIRDLYLEINYKNTNNKGKPLIKFVRPAENTNNNKPKQNSSQKKISYKSIFCIMKRKYTHKDNSAEFFLKNHTNFLVVFNGKKQRNRACKLFSQKFSKFPEKEDFIIGFDSRILNITYPLNRLNITDQWIEGKVTNFDYLMYLNTIAGRSFNDLAQYPIFPWILCDYTSENLDLTNPNVFRDFKKPMGALNEPRASEFIERYSTWDEKMTNIPKFHYGTHYSMPAVVLFFLIRLEPYTKAALEMQDGVFDFPDRLFYSVELSWKSASKDGGLSDVKELIPEFFYLPDFLENKSNYHFGTTQKGVKVDDVHLPAWAKNSSYIFIQRHREALESSYVSKNLHHWIDLIFGYKQRGKKAIESQNVFYHLTYESNISKSKITDKEELERIYTQINSFGQTPHMLFCRPHSQKNSLPKELLVENVYVFSVFQKFDPLVGNFYLKGDKLVGFPSNLCVIPPEYRLGFKWHLKGVSIHIVACDFQQGYGQNYFEVLNVYHNNISKEILNLEISTCGEFLVYSDLDGNLQLLQFDKSQMKLKKLSDFYAHSSVVTSISICAEFSVFVSVSKGGEIILWDINRLRLIIKLPIRLYPIKFVIFDKCTGDFAVCGDYEIELFDVNGLFLSKNKHNGSPITALEFKKYNCYQSVREILTGHKNGEVNVWGVFLNDDAQIAKKQPYRIKHLQSLMSNKNPIKKIFTTCKEDKKIWYIDKLGNMSLWIK